MPDVPESHTDLLDAKFATLATVGRDGRPQMTEVWFLHDNGDLKISLNGSRQKTKNLRQNPAVSLLVLDLANPFRYLEVRGDATVVPDDDYAFADRCRGEVRRRPASPRRARRPPGRRHDRADPSPRGRHEPLGAGRRPERPGPERPGPERLGPERLGPERLGAWVSTGQRGAC